MSALLGKCNFNIDLHPYRLRSTMFYFTFCFILLFRLFRFRSVHSSTAYGNF